MKLNQLADRPGAKKARTRIGRGIGSGSGKTGGRGGKGQTARSGVRIKGFEGGQMPLHRRLPKRGFNVPFYKKLNETNLERVQKAIDDGRLKIDADVDAAALVAAGLLRRALDGVRLLGNGEIKAKVNFVVYGASKSAVAAVEKAGGSVKILAPKKEEAERVEAKKPAKAETTPAAPKEEKKQEKKPAAAKAEKKSEPKKESKKAGKAEE
jgi:large subunit ribosomal protein L15